MRTFGKACGKRSRGQNVPLGCVQVVSRFPVKPWTNMILHSNINPLPHCIRQIMGSYTYSRDGSGGSARILNPTGPPVEWLVRISSDAVLSILHLVAYMFVPSSRLREASIPSPSACSGALVVKLLMRNILHARARPWECKRLRGPRPKFQLCSWAGCYELTIYTGTLGNPNPRDKSGRST